MVGVPLYGQETGASCQPRPSRPRACPATSPPCMGRSDMSIKAHSTVSIASHNMHGGHTPLTGLYHTPTGLSQWG